MSTNRDFDRIAGAWLADGPTELADRVLDVALEEVHLTQQRHALRVPWRISTMSTQFRLAAAAIVVVVALGLVALNLPRISGVGGPSASPPSPSPALVPTDTPSPSASPVAKAPAATVAELVDRVYAALHAKDGAALRAIDADDAQHSVYYTDGVTGSEVTSFVATEFDLEHDPLQDVTRQGEPLVVGDLVVVPVTYTYATEVDTGFDMFLVAHVTGGLLVGEGATFYGKPGLAIDPNAVATIEAEAAAWNMADTDAVLATMTSDAAFWEGLAGSTRTIHSGAGLKTFIEESGWFDVTITGTPVISGVFVAVPNRLSAGSDTSEGISLYDIRNGKIALQVYLNGTP